MSAEDTKSDAAAPVVATTTKSVVVAYYSRSGNTKAAAEALIEYLKKLGKDVEAVEIKVDEGNEGYIYNAYLAFRGKTLDVKNGTVLIGKDAKEVWLCGPVHCWSLCSALKKYVELNLETLKADGVELNALATMGGSGDDGFRKVIAEMTGKEVKNKITFVSGDVKDPAKLQAAFDGVFKKDETKAE